jgi:hypothetical protein
VIIQRKKTFAETNIVLNNFVNLLQNIYRKNVLYLFLQNARCIWKVVNYRNNNDPNVTIFAFTLLEYVKYVKSYKDH